MTQTTPLQTTQLDPIQLPDSATLLPPNATRFQRDLEQANGISQTTWEAVKNIKTIKSDPPDDVLYWLIWEYGLGALLTYIDDLKRLINEGLKWQRFRGTPDSLKLALGWIGIEKDKVEIDEEVPGVYFYQYQLKLDEIPDQARVDNIINLSKLSAPVRSRLSRLYNTEHDERRLILSDPNGNGEFGSLLSDYSGIHHKGIVLSFGRKSDTYISTPVRQVKDGQSREIKIKLDPFDFPILGTMQISDVAIPNHTSAIQRYSTIGFVHPGNQPFSLAGFDWFGAWGERTWEEPGFISLGIKQQRFHCFKEQIPSLDADKRRYTFHTYRVTIDQLESKQTQSRFFTLKDTLPIDSGDNSGVRILKYYSITPQITGFDADKRRYTVHTHRATIDDPSSIHTQLRTHTLEDTIPKESAGVHRYTSHSYPVQYTGVTSGTSIKKEIRIQGSCPADTDNPPRLSNHHLVSCQLKQTNGMPLFSAGSNWFGKWNERTWASPLFTNIGVIYGNTN
jgi:P2-related tail formation protein